MFNNTKSDIGNEILTLSNFYTDILIGETMKKTDAAPNTHKGTGIWSNFGHFGHHTTLLGN